MPPPRHTFVGIEHERAHDRQSLDVRPKSKPSQWSQRRIAGKNADVNEERFWQLLDLFDWRRAGDDDAVVEPAVAALAAHSRADIASFADLLAEKLHALDTRDHARAAFPEADPDDGDEYISADDFLYARCCVVANGSEVFGAVLADPTRMPVDMEFEALLSVASMAFERKTGEAFEHVSPVDFESFTNRIGWAATAATKAGRFTGPEVPAGNRRPAK